MWPNLRSVVLELEYISESPGGLVKLRALAPPSEFQSQSEAGPEDTLV